MNWFKIPTKYGHTLVPTDSIVAVEDDEDYNKTTHTYVYVKNIGLYTRNVDGSTRPELIKPLDGIEVIHSIKPAEELLMLLQMSSSTTKDGNNE